METLEIRVKDFLVKWVHAPDNSTIDWQVKPLKKSVSFAIYQKDEGKLTPSTDGSASSFQSPMPAFLNEDMSSSNGSIGSLGNKPSTSRMRSNSIRSVNPFTDSSIYKTKSRSSMFSANLNNSDLSLIEDYHKLIPDELIHGKFKVVKGGMFAFIFDNSFSKTTGKKVLFSTKIIGADFKPNNCKSSQTNLRNGDVKHLINKSISSNKRANSKRSRPKIKDNLLRPKNGELLQSVLLKRRRKKLQGFTKRFFVLNFKYGTLSYFRVDDNKLRGQMPIKHSVISANPKNREIIIDSGMEVWDLKCLNDQDFKAWVDSFNEIKKNQYDEELKESPDVEDILVANLEILAKKIGNLQSEIINIPRSQLKHSLDDLSNDIVRMINHAKDNSRSTMTDAFSMLSVSEFYDAKEYMDAICSEVVLIDQQNCTSNIIDSAISEKSFGSDESIAIEVYDSGFNQADEMSSSVESSIDLTIEKPAIAEEVANQLENSNNNDNNLYPLPIAKIEREYDIPVCNHSPPSIIAFVRKNIGKDLSTIAMTVDMNEPISILQRYSEMFEYCDLINNALSPQFYESSSEKILRVATFALSYLSGMRFKERNSRKPFTPLLGETFELVREDFGIRLISEKVCHRPPVYAIYAESENWTFCFSPSPTQKIWGKNGEIVTKGTAKLTDKATGEVFSWCHPTTLLKNIIAGEKYSEPSSTMTVKSSKGNKAIVEFARGGVFSGRSEDLIIKAYDEHKNNLVDTVSGKWTDSLVLKTKTTEKLIWKVGELLPNPSKKFGFTKFAGTLNKITEIENGKIAPTDSRLRPDIKIYEKGEVDRAEKMKVELETKQRARRNELEEKGLKYKPSFFKEVVGESPDSTEWVYIKGEKSYWNRRMRNDWDDITKIW